MSMSWMTAWVVTGLLGLAQPRLGEEEVDMGLPPPTNSSQGSQLHGTGLLEHVNIPLVNAVPPPRPRTASGARTCPTSVELTQGTLEVVGRCASTPVRSSGTRIATGKDLVGTKFLAPLEGGLVTLVITGVEPHVLPPELLPPSKLLLPQWQYKVMHEVKPGGCASMKEVPGKCVSICSTQTSNGHALAVPHAWSMSGELLRNPGYFTFACAPVAVQDSPSRLEGGGVIAKCIDWGLPPWATSRTPTGQDSPAQDPLAIHQACVRMAMADYCGEGRTNTIDGTPLAFYDLRGFQPEQLKRSVPATLKDRAGGEAFLEAIWAVDECGRVEPLCLGRKRWASLALDAACLDRSKVEGRAQQRLAGQALAPSPCEGRTFEAARNGEKPLLVSYSRSVDKLLVLFGDPKTGAYLTTSSVALEGDRVDVRNPRYQPALPLPDSARFPFIRVEGPILSHTLPPDFAKSPDKLKPLYRCIRREQDPQVRFVLSNTQECGKDFPGYALDVSHSDGGLEGYVFSSLRAPGGDEFNPESRLLRVWKHKELPLFAVSTEPPEGYQETAIKSLGYLPTVGMLPVRLMRPLTLDLEGWKRRPLLPHPRTP